MTGSCVTAKQLLALGASADYPRVGPGAGLAPIEGEEAWHRRLPHLSGVELVAIASELATAVRVREGLRQLDEEREARASFNYAETLQELELTEIRLEARQRERNSPAAVQRRIAEALEALAAKTK